MSDTETKNPATQAIIDRHLETLMKELEEADLQAVGVVLGVLCDGDTIVGWCIKDDVQDGEGKLVPVDTIVRDIAVEIELATAAE